MNNTDADKAAEESASLQFNKKYSKDNWTACVISFKAGVAWQSSQSVPQDVCRAALEKILQCYGNHDEVRTIATEALSGKQEDQDELWGQVGEIIVYGQENPAETITELKSKFSITTK